MSSDLPPESPGLRTLSESFRADIVVRAAILKQAWSQVCREGWDTDLGKNLWWQVHRLAGSGTTFGLEQVTQVARRILHILNPIRDANRAPTADECTHINKLIEALRLAALNSETQPPVESSPRTLNKQLVFLADDDTESVSAIEAQLRKDGFEVMVFDDNAALESSCFKQSPCITIMNPDWLNETNGSVCDAAETHACARHRGKLIALSSKADMATRLRAERADADHFLVKPVDLAALSQLAAELRYSATTRGARALVVDDDDLYAAYLQQALVKEGMEVQCLNDPLLTMDSLAGFKPDIMVIDMQMPGCTGLELAGVIRKDPAYQYIPIILVSGDHLLSQTNLQLGTVAEEFLLKPVAEDDLAQAVQRQISRNRRQGEYYGNIERALQEAEYERIANHAHNIVSMADAAGRITFANKKFCDISGYSLDELIGTNHRIVNSGQHPPGFFEDMWRTISQGDVWHGVICNQAKDGHLYWVDSTIMPFLDGNGIPYKYVSIRTDITGLLETQKALEASDDRLRRSQVFANIGTWDWNIQTGELYWSERIGPLFGYKDKVPETTYENFLAAVHPDDRQTVIDAVSACIEQQKDYDIEHRVVWPDGSIHWVMERGDVVRGGNNEPLHMLGVVQDITNRKSLEQTLAKQTELLSLLRNAMTDFVATSEIMDVSEQLLNGILKVTGSEYGFIGKILTGEDNARFLKATAISNVAWDKEALAFYGKHAPAGMEFHNTDTLFGRTVTTGETVISNNPGADPRSGGLPEGHPALNCYLGVPVYFGKELVGMFALANRAEGYDEALVEFLKPFTATYGVLIHAQRIAQAENRSREELLVAKEEAEHANRTKSDFLSSMSHELRTPMNAILGFGQLLEMEYDQPLADSQKQSVQEILKAGRHLLDLINEVLDLAKIEAGRIDLSLEAVSAAEIIRECGNLMQTMAKESAIAIELDLPDDTDTCLHVRADHVRLKQVFLNLISNAIKYNRERGTVRIACARSGDNQVRFSFSDEGEGIPEDKQEQLFQSFNRLGAERTEIEGTGIGLVITKRLVEFMGGNISYTSHPGVGTTFWVDLPYEQASTGHSSRSDSAEDVAGTQEEPDNIEHCVLYVEDNPANLRLVAQLLARRPHIRLLTAHTAELGIHLTKKNLPELILLDINLPGMNGFQVLQALQRSEATRHIPVAAISANAMPSDIRAAREAGFIDYLTKPIDVTAFFHLIDNILSPEH